MKENALAQFCDYKVSSCEGEDQETWLYLRILFEADPKRYILQDIFSRVVLVGTHCELYTPSSSNPAVVSFFKLQICHKVLTNLQ